MVVGGVREKRMKRIQERLKGRDQEHKEFVKLIKQKVFFCFLFFVFLFFDFI